MEEAWLGLKLVFGLGKGLWLALSLATTPAECSTPAVALVRYRLALLRFRSARSAEELAAVEEMLALAMLSPTLAPRAAVYRLAALARLRAVVGPGNRAAIDEKLALATKQARLLACAERRGPYTEDQLLREVPVQTSAFNLLELATLFLGGAYADLEGFGAGVEPFDRGEHAILLGPDPSLPQRRVTWAFATEELDGLADRGDDILLFRVPRVAADAKRWTRSVGWEPVAPGDARVLVAALDGVRHRDRELLRAVGAKTTDGSFRAALKRIRQMLATCSGRSRDEVLCGSLKAGITLGPGLNIHGAVHEHWLRGRHNPVTIGG